jgi:indole-3-glycerol phosphate synthase
VALFGVTGLVIDYIIHIKQKKEREKVVAYNATMRAANQLMRDLMNSMIILSASESVKGEFGDDISGIIDSNIRKMEEVLEALTGLKEITPEMIREISTPN